MDITNTPFTIYLFHGVGGIEDDILYNITYICSTQSMVNQIHCVIWCLCFLFAHFSLVHTDHGKSIILYMVLCSVVHTEHGKSITLYMVLCTMVHTEHGKSITLYYKHSWMI